MESWTKWLGYKLQDYSANVCANEVNEEWQRREHDDSAKEFEGSSRQITF